MATLDLLADSYGSSRSAVLSQILRQRFPIRNETVAR